MKYKNNLKAAVFLISTGSFLYIIFLIIKLLMVDYPESITFTNRIFQSLLGTLLWYSLPLVIRHSDEKSRKLFIRFSILIAANSALLLYSGLETISATVFVVMYIITILNILFISYKPVPMLLYILLTFFFNIPFTALNYGFPVVFLLLFISVTTAVVSFLVRLELIRLYGQMKFYDQARWAASEFVSINMRMQDNVDRSEYYGRKSERTRIAREIHDSVGYTLTAVLLQIQAAQEVLKVDPKHAMKRLKKQEDILRAAMQEVRREVSNLRDFSEIERTGKHRWERLCTVFGDSTGIRIKTNIPDSLAQVNEEISDNVYRIIQEAVTNAYRHGAADFIDVSMDWDKNNHLLLLRISDNGKGAIDVNPGNGLRGMKERVLELSGDILWETQPGRGFDVGVEILWEGE